MLPTWAIASTHKKRKLVCEQAEATARFIHGKTLAADVFNTATPHEIQTWRAAMDPQRRPTAAELQRRWQHHLQPADVFQPTPQPAPTGFACVLDTLAAAHECETWWRDTLHRLGVVRDITQYDWTRNCHSRREFQFNVFQAYRMLLKQLRHLRNAVTP